MSVTHRADFGEVLLSTDIAVPFADGEYQPVQQLSAYPLACLTPADWRTLSAIAHTPYGGITRGGTHRPRILSRKLLFEYAPQDAARIETIVKLCRDTERLILLDVVYELLSDNPRRSIQQLLSLP